MSRPVLKSGLSRSCDHRTGRLRDGVAVTKRARRLDSLRFRPDDNVILDANDAVGAARNLDGFVCRRLRLGRAAQPHDAVHVGVDLQVGQALM